MDAVGDTDLDVQKSHKVVASQLSETNSVAAEEEEEAREKAGTLESKHGEKRISHGDFDNDSEQKIDKLDELSSLEQEIAKMHNIQHCTESGQDGDTTTDVNNVRTCINENGSSSRDTQIKEPSKIVRGTSDVKVNAKEEPGTAAALEDVDLIALLKGTDQDHDQASVVHKTSSELPLSNLGNVGVTIEGEGQYEIMEIDDGDNLSGPSPELLTTRTSSTLAPKTGTKFSSGFGKPKLSPEQARAVALEQMANLKPQKARRKETTPAAVKPQQTVDIISSLNDDWNEYDSGSDNASSSNVNANANANAIATPAPKKTLVNKPKPALESPRMVGSVKVMLKSVNQKTLEKPRQPAEQPNNNSETTGFKRTRIIKRKIIWDPDAPETQKSFAQYATAKATTTNATATTTASAASTTTTTVAAALSQKATNVEVVPKKARPSTPKEAVKAPTKRVATPAETNANTSPSKRRSQTPNVPNGAGGTGKKKKVSEIDRLMGDEGAANMMQAVEREQRELSGGEAANKPLMRKRAMTFTGRPQKAAASAAVAATTATVAAAATATAETTPVSPKKDSPPKSNKRGAAAVDAVFAKAPKSRPSDSWDYVYKQRASEESMIMRRRSNSSYSSNASVSRLSLDNKPAAVANLSDDASDAAGVDPSFKFLKPENKSNQRSDGSPPQTLANDLKRGTLQSKEPKAAKPIELVTLHKLEKVTQVVISLPLTKTGYTYKLQLLQKLNEVLNKLAKSNDCNTVVLSVQGQHFCQGIDGQELVAATQEKRKSSATQLALVLKTYLRTLATFPKPLVAGIVGNLKNLGVMQLPLFDYVVAADDCCFETHYAKLGQLPEGYALWHKHHKASSQVQNRLFLLAERLHTSDLIDSPNSFIDKSCPTRSVNEETLTIAKLISSTTAEQYRALKKLNQTANTGSLQRLEAEFKIITEQWSSAAFQSNYKRYVNDVDV